MVSPPTAISPSSYSSSRLTQRRKVVLPEPLAPMIATTSPSCTSRSMPLSTSVRSKRLCTFCARSTGAVCAPLLEAIGGVADSFMLPRSVPQVGEAALERGAELRDREVEQEINRARHQIERDHHVGARDH